MATKSPTSAHRAKAYGDTVALSVGRTLAEVRRGLMRFDRSAGNSALTNPLHSSARQTRRGFGDGHLPNQAQHRFNRADALGHRIAYWSKKNSRSVISVVQHGSSIHQYINRKSVVVSESLFHFLYPKHSGEQPNRCPPDLCTSSSRNPSTTARLPKYVSRTREPKGLTSIAS